MSDGCTDAYRDQRRGLAYEDYLLALIEFLKDPADDVKRARVLEAAEATDRVPRGYWHGPTNLSDGLEKRLELLLAGDEATWGRLLRAAAADGEIFRMLKELSPFRGRIVVFVNYGMGFADFEGDVQAFMDRIVRNAEMKTYDCDKYLVAIPEPNTDECAVTWLACGIQGVKGPRKR